MHKRMIFNCFSMYTPSHIYHGSWRHPKNELAKFNDFSTWTKLVHKLEEGKFDAIFFADILGIDPAYDGKWDAFFEHGLHMPCNDTFTLCAALAGVTSNLGLVFTSSILSEHPFAFAKKASTLDHISGGRIGWNIVTSVTDNAARNFGFDKIVPHDQRYDWADEYMEVLYKLWEGSWDEGAMIADRENGVFSDHTKVHRINHVGERYKVQGPHLISPSPQRTPMLYQAGASKRGSQFAAQHAEGTFVLYPNVEGARIGIAGTKAVAAQVGRNAEDLKFIQGLSFVVGSTMEEAERKAKEIDEWVSYEGRAAHVSRDMGVDLAHLDPDQPVDEAGLDGLQGYARMIEMGKPNGEKATVKDLAGALSYNCRIVGTPESIADELERWQEAGVDGINMICQLHPDTFIDFIDHVTPVLQERGLAQREYAEGPLREKLFGRGPLLPATHRGSTHRGAFSEPTLEAAE
ncbi:LLM class flavin-dependent oxidoreductase [Rhizobium rhizogenes]|uniref:LLM class flavin-dependent oxidoreductase n=1 Tax=Rhizobium rhizogenes TaxID=359 RepID=UPI001571F9F1|nr:LLM class flavin-dependent oxidoreductase [Rhizobium rhizogenes]NTH22943.1 LLM class flavin-dependent oxidoreductase [Rhizobium rhizogenes]NTH35972.1 LLM class flavin-dependent oxidoreductase [Rhizobium rhizogenes]